MPGAATSAMIDNPPTRCLAHLALGHLLGRVPGVHMADLVPEQGRELGLVVQLQ